MSACKDQDLHRDWNYLQTSDHFYYMCTKWFSDGDVHQYFNPYGSPYDAFLNYMNILSDFLIRVNEYTERAPTVIKNSTVEDVIPGKKQVAVKAKGQAIKKTEPKAETIAKTAKKATAKPGKK
jgi:alpha-amylase